MTGWPVALAGGQTPLESRDLSESPKQNTLAMKKARGSRRILFPGCLEIIVISLAKRLDSTSVAGRRDWRYVAETERKYLDNTSTSRLDR